jgi:hypothetical protein
VTDKLDRVLFWTVSGLVLMGAALPYLVAFQAAGTSYEFGGFLVNPIDGHTYLAKMIQGASGTWRFTLPYTAEPGVGAYINLYYLALGHVAALTGLSNLLVYHAARLAGTFFMLYSIYRFIWSNLEEDHERRFAFLLAALGSGLGWLAALFGGFTADFWVAEAYPFLSALTNPHFPLGLGLLLWIMTPPSREGAREFPIFFWALAIGLISPFGLVLALGVLGLLAGMSLINWVSVPWVLRRFLWVLFGGGWILLYDYWAIVRDPILASWNAQNLTLSPTLMDLIISFSPALLLAGVGVWFWVRNRNGKISLPALWLFVVLGLIYLPFNLQRRLLTGFYIPIVVVAAVGLSAITRDRKKWFGRAAAGVITISALTNLFILLAGVFGAQSHDPLLYITRDEAAAFTWITDSTAVDAIILASPSTGLWLPSQTGRRVIYGHPFETVDASQEKAAVEAFYRGDWTSGQMRDFLQNRAVEYVFIGPRERELGTVQGLDDSSAVYQGQEVVIYAVQPEQEP